MIRSGPEAGRCYCCERATQNTYAPTWWRVWLCMPCQRMHLSHLKTSEILARNAPIIISDPDPSFDFEIPL